MAYTIPDNDEAFSGNPQSIWMQTDIDALVQGFVKEGVVSGCAVTAQGTPDMTVAVAAGDVRIGTAIVAVTGGNVTIATANGTNPRVDLISVNSSGTKVATAGTAAVNPKAPALPATSVLLAMVYVPANDTTIAANQIIDKRIMIKISAYQMSFALNSFNPADADVVYFGAAAFIGANPNQGLNKIYFRHIGRIISVGLMITTVTTAGSAENATFSLRKNGTTDTQISTVVQHNVSAPSTLLFEAEVNIPFVAGDYFEGKMVMPTWVTNPAGVVYVMTLEVEDLH